MSSTKKSIHHTAGSPRQGKEGPGSSPAFDELVSRCNDELRKGRGIVFPAHTGWCLGCDSGNEFMVSRILNFPGSVFPALMLRDSSFLGKYLLHVPDFLYDLIEFSEKPMYIQASGMVNLTQPVIKSVEPVSITVPQDPLSLSILGKYQKPIFTCIVGGNTSTVPDIADSEENYYVVGNRLSPKYGLHNLSVIRISAGSQIEIIKK